MVQLFTQLNIRGMRIFKKKEIYRGDDKLYLIRYTILPLTNKWFSFKVHHILLSDDDCLHDHPWAFISILLWGSYTEAAFDYDGKDKADENGNYFKLRKYSVGNILYRKALWAHKLILKPGKTVWSLVITFKKCREWGFFTPKGWIFWKNYRSTGSRCE